MLKYIIVFTKPYILWRFLYEYRSNVNSLYNITIPDPSKRSYLIQVLKYTEHECTLEGSRDWTSDLRLGVKPMCYLGGLIYGIYIHIYMYTDFLST